jgi:hypothetical protein
MESCKRVIVVLRLEGLALATVCTVAYGSLGESWWLFAALLLIPDISMLGYLAGPRIGAGMYNLAHNWLVVVVWLLAAWLFNGSNLVLSLPLILGAHIGIDRALGYGLKLPTSFHDTHLGRIGRAV